jgi:hypothetical protein
MKKIGKNIGLILIILGTLVLSATRFSTFSASNSLLLTRLFCIMAGIWFHIRSIKRDSLY